MSEQPKAGTKPPATKPPEAKPPEEKKEEAAKPKLADATPATVSEVLGQLAPYAKEGETLKQAFARVLKEYDAYKGAATKK